MMDFSGLPDQEQPESGGDLLSGLPDTNAGALRKQYRTSFALPDEAAQINRLSDRTGLPGLVVARNKQKAEQIASEPDWDALETDAPNTVQALVANTKLFEIAHDDTENLSGIEKIIQTIKPYGSLLKQAAQKAPYTAGKGLNEAVLATNELLGIGGAQRTLGLTDPSGLLRENMRWYDERIKGIEKVQPQTTPQRYAGMIFDTLAQNMLTAPLGVAGKVPLLTGFAATAGGKLDDYLEAGYDPYTSSLLSLSNKAMEGLTEMIAVGKLYQGGKPLARRVLEFMGSDLLGEEINTTYSALVDKGTLRPDLTLGEFTQQLVDTAVVTIGAAGGQAAITQPFVALSSQYQEQKRKSELQRFFETEAKALHAEQTGQAFAQLSALSAANKVRARDPKAFQEFIETANQGAPVQDIYLDARTLQQAGIDLDALAATTPEMAERVREAVATGGDIVVPVSEYQAAIAGGELDAQLTPHLRTSEDGLSPTEAQTFAQNQLEEFQKASARVMEEKASDETWQTSLKAVEDNIFAQLQGVKRFTDDVDRVNATVAASIFNTVAARTGVTPEEAFKTFEIWLTDKSVAGEQKMEGGITQRLKQAVTSALGLQQPATTPRGGLDMSQFFQAAGGTEVGQTETPEFKRWFGDSKVVDDEGKPLVVYHGTRSEPFSVFDKGKLGKETIGNATDDAYAATSLVGFWFNSGDIKKAANSPYERYKEVYLKIESPVEYGSLSELAEELRPYVENLGEDDSLSDAVEKWRSDTFYDDVDGLFVADEEFGGMSYVIFSPTQVKSAIGNRGTFDPSDPNILRQPTETQGGNRGEITLADDITQQPTIISLLAKADLSTFLHEMGHFQLEVLSHLASQPDAPAQIAEDFDKVLQWFGITGSEEVGGGEQGGGLAQTAADFGTTVEEAQRQYDEVVAKYQGTDQWLKAPNGQPTKLNERQWVQVRTEAFKAWFGDWEKHARGSEGDLWSDDEVSKVVDKNTREPLVVYHGTQSGGFTEFDSPTRVKVPGAFFFTKDRDVARTYAGSGDTIDFEDEDLSARGIYETFLNIRTPQEAYFEGANWDGGRTGQWEVYDEDNEEQVYSSDGRAFFDSYEEADKVAEPLGVEPREAGPHYETTDSVAREAQRGGSDGAIIYEVSDSGSQGDNFDRTDLYIAFSPNQIKSAIGNTGQFSAEDPNILHQGDPPLEPAGELPKRRTAREVWQAMSLEEKRPYHEQFARGFEAYLFEGKAPSQELRPVFARLRAWLLRVYRSLANLKVEISDDLRGVFDRMLATDEAIREAEQLRKYGELFTAPEGDQAAWGEMQQAGAEATQTATEELQRRSLRDMQWLSRARGRVLKQLQREAKAKRDAIEEEVTKEVRELPVYAAIRFLRYGVDIAGQQVPPVKLDLPALKEMYGEEPNALWRYLSTGRRGLAASKGIQPDAAAEMFGFTSGDQLVREILAAQPEASVIEGMTDQRMLERYGDIASQDGLERAADEAIHNEARARFLATQLKMLDKANTPARVIAKAAKSFAEAMIARKQIRAIKPRQHSAAEIRAAKAVEQAMRKGDVTAAATATRDQLVQNYSTRLSYEALTEIDKAVKYLRKFDKESVRKGLDMEYVDQIDQLLERFDLRASTPLSAAAKRTRLLAWVENQREQGFEPDIPEELLTEALRKPYRELTLEEMRGLVDTVKQIEHLGRLKQKLLTAKDQREFEAVRNTLAESIIANAKGVVDLRTRSNAGGTLRELGKKYLAMHRKMASMARELDGFKDGGPMWEYFIRSMNTAGDQETSMRAEATRKLYELVKPLTKSGKMGGKGVFFPSIGMSLNREERIAIALNMGNESNMQRLLGGEGWTLAQLQPVLDTITPEEADFVQAVWDFFESYRPEIGEKEKRVYGKEPEWIAAQPVTLGGKTLRGGYYPVKYDPRRSGRAEQHADAEAAKQQMRGAYTTATTRRSFTKTRAEEVTGRPLLYSFAGIYQGASEVIHDLSWHEWLIDANRLLRALDGPIRTHYGAETVGVFKKAIEDIATGDAPPQNAFEVSVNHIRTGATIAGLGWNLMTSLLQPLGLTQSMVRVGPGWVAKGMTQWLKAPIQVAEDITNKSAFMRDRARTMQREINEIQNQIKGSELDPVRATFFVLIQKAQAVADIPTWLGAYEKAAADGNSDERAIALADQAVIDSQGGGQVKDLAQIQRGGPLLKLWTNFYSFFNVVYNLGVEKTKEKMHDPKLYPSLALDYLLLYILPSSLGVLMRQALTGGDDDDLVEKLIADQISYLFGLMIGLRELQLSAQKIAGVEQFKGGYGGPAGLRLFQEVDKLGTQIAQGEPDMALFKALDNVGGIMLHYPSGQVNRTVDGAAAMIEGRSENPMVLLTGPRR